MYMVGWGTAVRLQGLTVAIGMVVAVRSVEWQMGMYFTVGCSSLRSCLAMGCFVRVWLHEWPTLMASLLREFQWFKTGFGVFECG